MAAEKGGANRGFGTLPTEPARPRRVSRGASGEVPALPTGTILGKYRIVRRIGAGGMGAVYEATHLEIGKPVALKVLSDQLVTDQLARARFLREAETASRLQHRHVVNVMDYGSEDGVPFLVMELLRGEDLAMWLRRFPHRLPVEQAVDIMLAVIAGVSAAHRAGVVHRDLKPRNVFLARTQLREVEPKVLDFGISKVQDHELGVSLTDTGEILGTTHYLSPEQTAGRPADARSDQYALAVVLYECVTGRVPHEGKSSFEVMRNIGAGKFLPPSALQRQLPEGCEVAILRAMSRDPNDRFTTAHDFGGALVPFASRKKRLVWEDYYRGEPCATAATSDLQSAQVPLAAVAEGAAGPGAVVRDRPRQTEHPVVPTRSGLSRVATHSRAWAVVAGLGVVSAAAFLLVVGSGGTSGHSNAIVSVPSPPTTNSGSAPRANIALAPANPPVERRRRMAGEVLIEVADAPPGLTVFVDGQRSDLPLRWPREERVRHVTFHAPGYEARSLSLAAGADRTIVLGMRPVPAGESAPAPTEKPAPVHDKSDLPPQTPPPLMDL